MCVIRTRPYNTKVVVLVVVSEKPHLWYRGIWLRSNVSRGVYVSALTGRPGWKSRPPPPKCKMTSVNIIRQEELIAQKKKEIEAKMAEQAKKSLLTPAKPIPLRYESSNHNNSYL